MWRRGAPSRAGQGRRAGRQVTGNRFRDFHHRPRLPPALHERAGGALLDGPRKWDLWWSQFFGDPETGELGTPPLPFNPKIGAGVYLNHLYLPIGPFPNVGWYHLRFSQLQVRPFTDLIPIDDTSPRPMNAKPGPDSPANWENEFDFYVGP